MDTRQPASPALPFHSPSTSTSHHSQSASASSLSPQKRHVRAVAEERLKASTPKNPISRKGILFRKGTKILAPGVGAILLSPPGTAPVGRSAPMVQAPPPPKKSHRRMDPKELEQRKLDRERMLKEQRRRNREERREKEALKAASGGGGGGPRRIEQVEDEEEEEQGEESEGEKEDPVWVGFREDFFEIVEQLPLEVNRSFSLLKELEEQAQTDTSSLHGLVREYLARRLGPAPAPPARSQTPAPEPEPASPAAVVPVVEEPPTEDGNAEAGPSGFNGAAMDVDEADVSALVASEPRDDVHAPEGTEDEPAVVEEEPVVKPKAKEFDPFDTIVEVVIPVDPWGDEARAKESLRKAAVEAPQLAEELVDDAPGSPQLAPPSSDRDPMDIISEDSQSHRGELVPQAHASPEKRSPSVVPATPSPAKVDAPELHADVEMDASPTKAAEPTDALLLDSNGDAEPVAPVVAAAQPALHPPPPSAPSSSAYLNSILNLPIPSDLPSTTTTTLLSAPSTATVLGPTATLLSDPPRSPIPLKSPTPNPQAPPMHRNTHLLTRISSLLSTLLRTGEEKIAIAKGTYDRVDRSCRSLDQALHTHTIAMQMGAQAAPEVGVSEQGGGVRRRRTRVESEDVEGVEEGGGGREKRRKSGTVEYAEEDGEWEDDGAEEEEDEGHGGGRRKGRKGRQSAAGQVVEEALDYMDEDPNEPRYCYCNRVSFGDMIGCENEDCEREWFHYDCVGITKGAVPERWWCDDCKPGAEVISAPPGRRGRR